MNNNFINFYKSFVFKKYKSISLNKIKIGDLISINYPTSEHNKNPHIFVLNPNFDGLLHGLVIDYINYYVFKQIYFNLFGKVKKMNLNLENKMFINTTAKTLYEGAIKNNIKRFNLDAYRTYKINNIRNPKIISFELI